MSTAAWRRFHSQIPPLSVGFDARLPIAVQVVAHHWRDDIALRAAAAIEVAS